MAHYPSLVATAVANDAVIYTDIAAPFGAVPVVLVASTDIQLLHFLPGGALPIRPFLDGSEIAKGVDNGTYVVNSGASFNTFANEAVALIAAGAATAAT